MEGYWQQYEAVRRRATSVDPPRLAAGECRTGAAVPFTAVNWNRSRVGLVEEGFLVWRKIIPFLRVLHVTTIRYILPRSIQLVY